MLCGDGGGCSCRVGLVRGVDVELSLFIKVSSIPSLSELGLPNIIK
jgi:hypothetical protein